MSFSVPFHWSGSNFQFISSLEVAAWQPLDKHFSARFFTSNYFLLQKLEVLGGRDTLRPCEQPTLHHTNLCLFYQSLLNYNHQIIFLFQYSFYAYWPGVSFKTGLWPFPVFFSFTVSHQYELLVSFFSRKADWMEKDCNVHTPTCPAEAQASGWTTAPQHPHEAPAFSALSWHSTFFPILLL